MIPISVDRASEISLQDQIFEQVREMVLSGRLVPGYRMPGSRRLARDLGVARNTVSYAYDRLVDEGYLSVPAGGRTCVTQHAPDFFIGRPVDAGLPPADRVVELEDGTFDLSTPETAAPFDLFPGRPDTDLFPRHAWRRCVLRALDQRSLPLTEYHDPAGLLPLRTAIAAHIGATRGIRADPSQVVITGGIQDALNLAARLTFSPGNAVVCEDPCYRGFCDLMAHLGATLLPVGVDENGLRTEDLPPGRASLCYVTPSHQFPTGATLTASRRRDLLEWAEGAGAYIVEDDYDSDFRYDGPPLTALAGLSDSVRVLYCGTFSKSLGPGLRLGYLVVPAHLAAEARQAKSFMNHGHSLTDQLALAEFITSGQFASHLRRIRRVYKTRRDVLLGHLRRHLGLPRVAGTLCGMHVLLQLSSGYADADELCRKARPHGLRLDFVGGHTSALLRETEVYRRGVILGYASLSEEEIAGAVQIMRQVLLP